jgi:hypothetical protein
MQHDLHLILSDCKVVFARSIQGFSASEGCVVFNAPRPLLGAEHPCTDWCHGRFYSEIDLGSPHAAAFIEKNNGLDARVVVPITDAEAVEMLLMGTTHADDYREYEFEEQLEMLLPHIGDIQHLPYGEAMALLDAAQAMLKADAKGEHSELALPETFQCEINLIVTMASGQIENVVFCGDLAGAEAIRSATIQVCQSPDGGLVIAPVSTTQAGVQAVVLGVNYRLSLTCCAASIDLGTFTEPTAMVQSARQLNDLLAV